MVPRGVRERIIARAWSIPGRSARRSARASRSACSRSGAASSWCSKCRCRPRKTSEQGSMPRRAFDAVTELVIRRCSAPASSGYSLLFRRLVAPIRHDRRGRAVIRSAANIGCSRRQMRGRFITFEGGEGTGKSTSCRAAGATAARARHRGGADPRARRFAGRRDHPACAVVGAAKPLGPEAEAILFAAARDDHIRNTIAPALARGRWVICDRFSEFDPRLPGRTRRGRRASCCGRLSASPSATSSPTSPSCSMCRPRSGWRAPRSAVAAPRATASRARRSTFHERLREAFRDAWRAEPKRCVLIDATRPAPDGGRADLERGQRAARSGDRAGGARGRRHREAR